MTGTLPRWQNIALWIVTVLLAALFLMAGGTKLMGQMGHPEHFAHWGYPLWFMYVTGAVEVLGAVLLLIPQTTGFGAIMLTGTMLGAIYTHLTHNEARMIGFPVVLLALVVLLGYARRDSVLTHLGISR